MRQTNRWREITTMIMWAAVFLTSIPTMLRYIRDNGGLNLATVIMVPMAAYVLFSAGSGLLHKRWPLLADGCLGLAGLSIVAAAAIS